MRIITLLLCGAALLAAQSLSLDPATDLQKTRARVDESWAKWQANDAKLEKNLLKRPRNLALEDVDRGEQRAEEYLDARRDYYKTMARSFRDQMGALDSAAASPLATSELKANTQKSLEDLIKREEASLAEAQSAARGEQTARAKLQQEALEQTRQELKKLREATEARAKLLDKTANTASQYEQARTALSTTFGSIANSLEERAESIDSERVSWKNYYAGLRSLIQENGAPATAAKPVKKDKKKVS